MTDPFGLGRTSSDQPFSIANWFVGPGTVDGSDSGSVNDLQGRTQDAVTAILQAMVKGSTNWTGSSTDVFAGLRSAISLPLAIIEKLIQSLLPFGLGNFIDVEHALDTLETAGENLFGFLGDLNPLDPSFDIGTAAAAFITNVLSPTGLLATLAATITAVVQGLFGISGGDSTMFTTLGSNLMAMLGGPNLLPGGTFDPISQGAQMLQNVLTPGGALSTFTQLPAHLLAELGIGQASANLLPAGGFDDPSVVIGTSGWTYDATTGHTTNGSVWASGAGILRQMLGVAIGTKPNAITLMSCWTKWTSVVATTGAAICLCANAYSDAAATVLISDPTHRVLAKITTPGTSSTGFSAVGADGASAADSNGWVELSGQYQAPAGTMKVRLVLEVELVVNAGSVGFDDCTQTIQTGILDSSLLNNIENIPQLLGTSVGGFGGIADLIATFQNQFDGLGSAFTQGGGLSGVDMPTLFSLAQAQTNNSITAVFQAALHTLILGNRTNKPASMGANPTSQTSITAGHYSNPATGALVTSSLTTGNAMAQRFTVPEFATFGFLELLVSGTGVTNVFANVYKVDPVTNVKTTLFNSSNIAALVPSTLTDHVRVLLPGMAQVQASDELFMEIVNNGTNALTVVTKTSAIPNNSNEVIKNLGWTRTVAAGGVSPTSLTSAQGTYVGTVPYAVLGISTVPANYQPPSSTSYLTSGGFTWTPPAWQAVGDIVDLVGVGSGGGGGGSFNFVAGGNGDAGTWQGVKLIVGTTIKIGTTVAIVIGTEGSGGSAFGGAGTAGTATTFIYQDPGGSFHTVTCNGGGGGANGGGSGGVNGLSPGNFTFDMVPYFGGAQVGVGAHGSAPGGGGGGGPSYGSGGTGSDGSGWVRAAQP